MPRITYNAATKRKSTARRTRRASVSTRARYLPRTTKANRALIKSNASAIRSIRKILPPAIYTDYQYTYDNAPPFPTAPDPYFAITNNELMSPNLWASVLRKDDNVEQGSSTMLKRMQINLRFSLGENNWCQISTFIVTIRKDATNRVINQAGLVEGDDYIFNIDDFQPRLNSNVFKVLYRRHVTLMAGSFGQAAFESAGDTLVAQSTATFKKGQVNIPLNFKVRQPNGQTWRTMDQSQLAPHQRYFQLTFFRGQATDASDAFPQLQTDILYTAYNSG